jgi:hypothetical protein
MVNGIAGSDGTLSCPHCGELSIPIGLGAWKVTHKSDCTVLTERDARVEKHKEDCLWVSYRLAATNNIGMESDGFYDGKFPLTEAMLNNIKKTIAETTQEKLDQLKPVDAQGKVVVGMPKPKIQIITIICIQPAIRETEHAIN